ncbi:MAG TPA: prepilin-type N-terminal cleavage/methylation domain-containing protein, partial [Gemmataceae bacterium]|nr:prepilin-type N-terminal cleavage/methylation domain-containing protein [Gemmataceae bacterium]
QQGPSLAGAAGCQVGGEPMLVRQVRRAYTLIEVLLVMAVIVIISAISFPAIDAMMDGVKMDGASDAVRAAWGQAQSHAVNEGRPYRFSAVPGKGNYRVAPASGEYWQGGNTPTPDDPENPPYVLEYSLPRGVIFSVNGEMAPAETAGPEPEPNKDTVPSNEWSGAITAIFLPDGTAEDDAQVTLRLSGARPITLSLRALTGVTSAQRGEE